LPADQSFEFCPQESGENYDGLSLRPALPGDKTLSVAWDKENPPKVRYVYWNGSEHESYEYSNYYWLLELEDGRFASVSQLSSGTCSYCGSCSDDIAFARDILTAIQFGMGENERRMMGLSS
jgi:hypothetical protein